MSFSKAFLSIAAVLVVHAFAGVFGLYDAWPSFDVPMHFAGGAVMGILACAIHHHLLERKHVTNPPLWFPILFILSFVMFIGVAWEGYEWIFDHTLGVQFGFAPSQPSVTDTMGDFLMDALGGLLAALAFRKKF